MIVVPHRQRIGWVLISALVACATVPSASRYRLAHSGSHWDVANGARVFDDVRTQYPDFFAVVLDPERADEPDIRVLRADLEREPTDSRNFDALNALAIAYFEYNYRAEAVRGDGLGYLSLSFQSAKLLAIPWRAYGLNRDAHLRDAILDFFEDAGSGEKLGTAATAPRVIEIVASLESKERDLTRRARIRAIADAIEGRARSEAATAPDPAIGSGAPSSP